MWTVFLIMALVAAVLSGGFAIVRALSAYKSNRLLDPVKILSIGVGATAVLLFVPVFLNVYQDFEYSFIEAVLVSLNTMVKLFVADGDYESVIAAIPAVSGGVMLGYRVLLGLLFVVAPVMTFSFVLSFFKNLSARFHFAVSLKRNIAVFSELNERSLILANDLKKDHLIVFTDVFERDDEENYESREKAKELGAVCFRRDIAMLDLHKKKKKARLKLFILGADRTENIRQSIKLIKDLRDRPQTDMYILSSKAEDDHIIVNALDVHNEHLPYPAIHVYRTNEVTSLIFRNLHDKGYSSIFQSARETADGDKEIVAVVVGMGQHGTEMVKALSWMCQMDGYKAYIHAFEKDIRAKDRFCSQCPELMEEAHNGRFDVAGEARYEITVHSGYDVSTKSFDDQLKAIPPATYVFVATGDDDLNLEVALKLRMLYKRMGIMPVIQAVVYNPEKRDALSKIRTFKNQDYDIDLIGDMRETFSAGVILNSDLEKKALARHTKWGNTPKDVDAFWLCTYNYKSSVASAIHHDMKVWCGIPGADQEPEEREPQARQALRVLEHNRWNAYMRSEGYVYSGSPDPSSRDDIAKKHHCLVPFDMLSEKEQKKDDD